MYLTTYFLKNPAVLNINGHKFVTTQKNIYTQPRAAALIFNHSLKRGSGSGARTGAGAVRAEARRCADSRFLQASARGARR